MTYGRALRRCASVLAAGAVVSHPAELVRGCFRHVRRHTDAGQNQQATDDVRRAHLRTLMANQSFRLAG